MGRLDYGSRMSVDFEDRDLYHLQTVIVAKLRCHESFLVLVDKQAQYNVGEKQHLARSGMHPSLLLLRRPDPLDQPRMDRRIDTLHR